MGAADGSPRGEEGAATGPTDDRALDEEDAAALAAFINENDPCYRAVDLFVPSAGSTDKAFYLVILTDRRGGNPPALRSLEDYRRHMADQGYEVAFRGLFEVWAWMHRREC
jgi:hypothetical protein